MTERERIAREAAQYLRMLETEGLRDFPRRASFAAAPQVASASSRAAASPPSPDSERPAARPLAGQPVPDASRPRSLEEQAAACRDCTLCKLAGQRTQVVFGVGNPRARLMLIGEGPGRDEDLKGEPFVGAAGQLLDRMLAAMGSPREEVYIANAVKCRPPNNRNPEAEELDACRPYLLEQVAAVAPEMIVILGRVAMQTVLDTDAPLGRMRGRVHDWNGIPVVCTYHPAYLLRTPGDKAKTWADMQIVIQHLGLEPPAR